MRLIDADSFVQEHPLAFVRDVINDAPTIVEADMFSDLKAEISMYENSEQSIDEMIQGIKSIISIYEW